MTKRRLNERGQERSLNARHDWNESYCSTRHQGFGGVGCHRCGVHGRRALLYLAASPSAPRSKSTEADSRPRVEVVHPRRITVARRLQTNATLEAFEETDLFAKVSGYLSDVRVDIGDHVKAGQVLAVIDIPEMEQELAEAKAQLKSKEFARERAPRTGALQGEHNASGRLVEAPGGAVHGTLDQRPGA